MTRPYEHPDHVYAWLMEEREEEHEREERAEREARHRPASRAEIIEAGGDPRRSLA